MNVFRQTIQDLGLTHESQGTGDQFSWFFVLLNVMADNQDANPTEPVFPTNPAKEVSYRLQPYLGTFAGQQISKILNTLINR